MASEQDLAALAARMGIEYPPTSSRVAAALRGAATRSDSSSAGATSSENTPMPMRRHAQPSGSSPPAPMIGGRPAFDDSASLADSDLDITEKGLHKALAQSQAENRSLRQQLASLHDREVQIVALSSEAREHFNNAQQQLNGLKERLRGELRHPVTEDVYRDLIHRGESERDLVDEIRIVVYERLSSAVHARRVAEESIESLRTAVLDNEARVKQLQMERAMAEAESMREVESLKAQLDVYRQRADLVEQMSRDTAMTVDLNQAKAARCDTAEAERERLQKQLDHERDNAATYEAKYRQTAAELTGANEEMQRTQVLLHSAQAEVTFLSKERDILSQRSKDAEQRVASLELSHRESQNQRVESTQSAAKEREDLRVTFERHTKTEMQRMRDQYAEDLERMRTATRDASERELQAARDARDNEMSEAVRLRGELQDVKTRLEAQTERAASRLEEAKVSAYDLRLQLSNKTNEALRLDLQLQECEGVKERLKIDAECLQRKLDILKEEFYELKSSHREEVNALGAKLAAQDEQLQLMRDMETEAEVYLANVARSDANPADAALALADVPASRRVTNAVTVTRKALALENEIELLKHDKGTMQVRCEKLAAELEMAKEVLRNGNSPFAMMEESMHRKDQEINRLQRIDAIHTAQAATLEEKLRVAQQDIRVLQSHRAELVRIKQYLQQMQQQQQHPATSAAPAAASPLMTPQPLTSSAAASPEYAATSLPLGSSVPAGHGFVAGGRPPLGPVESQNTVAASNAPSPHSAASQNAVVRHAKERSTPSRVFVGTAIEL